MILTPEQSRIARWIDERYDLDQIVSAVTVTNNAVRFIPRGGEAELLICRQDGTIKQVAESELYGGAD